MKKSNLGGKRSGAGRPKGEKKKAIGIRVPMQHYNRIIALIRKELAKIN